MQINSSTIGSLYSTTISPRFTATASGSPLDRPSTGVGADVVTLSEAARSLADSERISPDSANAAKDTSSTKTPTEAEAAHDAAVKAVNDYVEKGPVVARIEAIREQVLKSMGLSEADLKNLPPQQQQQIEATIAERIKEELMQKKADKSSTTIQQSEIAQRLLNPSGAAKAIST